MSEEIAYSVVIPAKNEEDNLEQLTKEIYNVMNDISPHWEMIIVNDASTDATLDIAKKLRQTRSFLRIINLPQNLGEAGALYTGFQYAKGNTVISIDADLQNDPKDIPLLIEKSHHYDLVCGWRQRRYDVWYKRLISPIANAIRSRFCKDIIHDTGCTLRVYNREKLSKIKMYKGMHRFIAALFVAEGFSVTEVPVNHRPRFGGTSKYNLFNRGPSLIIDMLAVKWIQKRHIPTSIAKEID